MVNQELMSALEDGDKAKVMSAVYWTFLHGVRQAFDALYEVAESHAPNAKTIVKESFDRRYLELERRLNEVFVELAKRKGGAE